MFNLNLFLFSFVNSGCSRYFFLQLSVDTLLTSWSSTCFVCCSTYRLRSSPWYTCCSSILHRRYSRCLSRIVLGPLHPVDRCRCCFHNCSRVGLVYLPMPKSGYGKVVQRWIDGVYSVHLYWNVDLGDDFWKLFVTLLKWVFLIHVFDLPNVFWLLPRVWFRWYLVLTEH